MSNLPTISIVTCNFNSNTKIFEKSLRAVKRQKYPKEKIEHIVMDGGSTNGSSELASDFGCKLFIRKDLLTKPLTRMSLGIKKAQHDIILILEPDNIIQGDKWLEQMVAPFINDKKIIGTYSMHNGFEKNMPLLTKYYALIGANDPTLLYLNKSEKMPKSEKKYTIGKIINENTKYVTVEFNHTNLPTLGDNGHMIRRSVINRVNKNSNTFLHTDAFADLIDYGYYRYGVVKNSIIHFAGADIIQNLIRRTMYKETYIQKKMKRTYLVYNPLSRRDKINLIKFIVYSITIIQPIAFSIKGYVRYRDVAWFMHPIMSIGTVFSYAVSELKSTYK